MTEFEKQIIDSMQGNANEFGKCNSCGKLLTDKQEKEIGLCKECQRRGKDKDIDINEAE